MYKSENVFGKNHKGQQSYSMTVNFLQTLPVGFICQQLSNFASIKTSRVFCVMYELCYLNVLTSTLCFKGLKSATGISADKKY
jgi:hypothetical protein